MSKKIEHCCFIIYWLNGLCTFKKIEKTKNMETIIFTYYFVVMILTGLWNSFLNNINWSLWVWEDKKDFLIGDISQLPVLEKQDTVIFEYNQWSSKDCTLYWPIGALSDLFNIKLTIAFIARVVAESFKRWRRFWKGRFTQAGVKCTCDIWNKENPRKKVAYYQIKVLSETALEALRKNYTLVVTYRWNSKYNLEYLKYIAIVSWNFWKKTYWHCTNLIERNLRKYIKDSYKGRKTKYGASNIYELKAPMKKLVGDTYYANAYLIVPIKSRRLEELKRLKELEMTTKATIELNENKIKLTNDKIYIKKMKDAIIADKNKLVDIQKEFDKLW